MSSGEEIVDIEVRLTKEVGDKYNKLTKKELLSHLYVLILKGHVQAETIDTLNTENTDLRNEAVSQQQFADSRLQQAQNRLTQAEKHGEQARVMLEAIMNQWYDYDDD